MTRKLETEEALSERIKKLEAEKEALQIKLLRYERRPSPIIGQLLLLFGASTLVWSAITNLTILAFIGLGLTFWGALLQFVKPTRYVRSKVLNFSTISSLATISKIMKGLNYRGRGIYLPSQYLKGESLALFVPAKDEVILPPLEEIMREKIFYREGICIIPPGLGLASLYEEELGIDFSKIDLDQLQGRLSKLLIEDLELAVGFEMNVNEDLIHVKMVDSIYSVFCGEIKKAFFRFCTQIGCPMCSSIACALTKVTGKPVLIERSTLLPDGTTIEKCFRFIEDETTSTV